MRGWRTAQEVFDYVLAHNIDCVYVAIHPQGFHVNFLGQGANATSESLHSELFLGLFAKAIAYIAQFCAQAGMSQDSFYAWKRRLRAGERSPDRKLRRQNAALMTRSLIPIRLVTDPVQSPVSTTGAIEVAWPGGIVLRVPAACNPDTLRHALV